MKKIKYHDIISLEKQKRLRKEMNQYFKNSIGSYDIKISQFTKYIPESELRKFLFKVEIFKKILNIHGSIIELGVLFGGGLMSWAKLSSIYEPANYLRRIIGFDTFTGFPSISKQDTLSELVKKKHGISSPKKHDFFADTYADILKSIEIYDNDRYYGNSPKIELIKGDVTKTIPRYLKDNPHTIVSLLNLDLDLYKPTKIALKYFLPRMSKGAIICFDEVNHPYHPGETLALLEEMGINNVKLQRFDFAPAPSFIII